MSLPARGSPTLVQALPGPSVQVTAGSNHTAVLLMDGQVFTFGSFSVSGNISFYTPCKSTAFLEVEVRRQKRNDGSVLLILIHKLL